MEHAEQIKTAEAYLKTARENATAEMRILMAHLSLHGNTDQVKWIMATHSKTPNASA